MTRPRPVTASPADGRAMTLDDLSAFVAEAYSKGLPGSTYVRTMGALGGFDMTNGPLCSRLTAIPGQVSTDA